MASSTTINKIFQSLQLWETLDSGQLASMLKSNNVFNLRLGSECDIGGHANCVAAIPSPRQPFFSEPIQERWTSAVFQICTGRDPTNHNYSQSLWLWPTNWVRICVFWVFVAQASLLLSGLHPIDQKCVGGVTSNDEGTLPKQKLSPSDSSFWKQSRS